MSFTFSFLAILLVMNSPITADFQIQGGSTHVYKYRRHTDMTYHAPLPTSAKRPQAAAKPLQAAAKPPQAAAKPKASLETNRLVDIIDKIMGEL